MHNIVEHVGTISWWSDVWMCAC